MQALARTRVKRGWSRVAPPSNPLFRPTVRTFAGGEEIPIPKVYKNVFNKRVSRDGKRVMYTVYPVDYNEPWPFAPVYDDDGMDLNQDWCWPGRPESFWTGRAQASPCSITGKPKRQLGHYPWLGRSIVPYDEGFQWICDDQVAPRPWFGIDPFNIRHFVRWWVGFVGLMMLFMAWIEYWRGPMTHQTERNDLWYRECMCPSIWAYMSLATTRFANPEAPIYGRRAKHDRWRMEHTFFSHKNENVWVPGNKEDRFGHCRWDKFSFETDGWIHPALRRRNKQHPLQTPEEIPYEQEIAPETPAYARM
jgi:hypothetical protein